jgi:hypothetical protein
MVETHDHQSIEAIIADALQKIHAHNFCTLTDYEQLVSSGVLVKKPLFASDHDFQLSHPNHPLSPNSLTPRMQAADAIRDNVKRLRQPLRQGLLDGIHTALLDCSGAVRHSLAQALLYTDSVTSVPHLQELLSIDKHSRLVLQAARAALLSAQMDVEGYVQPGDRLIMLISRREDLIIRLSEVAEQTGCKLFMPRRNFSELIAWRSEVQIVDRWFMGSQDWNSYCQYLQDVNKEEDYPIVDTDGEVLLDEPVYDHSPLILVDNRMVESRECFASPLKPKNSLFYLEAGPDDLVGEIVRRALIGGNMDLQDIINTVNRQRAEPAPQPRRS